jgi:hypothetical protein
MLARANNKPLDAVGIFAVGASRARVFKRPALL